MTELPQLTSGDPHEELEILEVLLLVYINPYPPKIVKT